MSEAILVTAAGDSFFEWSLSLISSLRDLQIFPRIPFAVVDVGLEPWQRRMLVETGVVVMNPRLPSWWRHSPIDHPGAASQLTRPYYCEMFSNAKIIVHIDADVWIADTRAVESAIVAARSIAIDLAAAVHSHPSYITTAETRRWRVDTYNIYASDDGRVSELVPTQYVNAGVFAARVDSPLWGAWQRIFERIANRDEIGAVNDQAALNVAIHEARLRLHRLDATCNWLTHLALPAVDQRIRRLVEPVAPFRPLSAIHVSGAEKDRRHSIPIMGGSIVISALDRTSFIRASDRRL